MNNSPLPAIKPSSVQLSPNFSLYLDALRFLAALLVYIAHAGHFAQARIPFLGRSGSQGVIIFFVLSGFVIAFTALRRHGNVNDYMIARCARLWSIVLPAILLTMVLDVVGQQLFLAAYDPMQPYTPFKWAASAAVNALFLNQVWLLDIWLGTNGPFWSLSYEFWYYAIFAPLIYFRGRKRILWTTITALIAGPGILVALPIWLMGVALFHGLKLSGNPGNPAPPFFIWILTAVLLLGHMVTGGGALFTELPFTFYFSDLKQWDVNFWPESYLLGILVTLHLYAFSRMNVKRRVTPALGKWVKMAAETSFGLYLFHYPLMYFTKALLFKLGVASGMLFVGAVYVLPFVVSVYLALRCEPLKKILATALHRLADRSRHIARARAGASVSPKTPLP